MAEPELRRAHNEAGGYWFLPGIQAYSAGVIADERHHIVHLRLRDPTPLEAGMDVARLLLVERVHRGTRRGRRALGVFSHAVLVLRWFTGGGYRADFGP